MNYFLPRKFWHYPYVSRGNLLFDDIDLVFSNWFEHFENTKATKVRGGYLKLQENDQGYLLSIDMPGVSRNDVNVSVKGDNLIVSAEKRVKNLNGENYTKESFYESFSLSDKIDKEKIEANYENGVVFIAMAKAKANERKIELKNTKGSFFNSLLK